MMNRWLLAFLWALHNLPNFFTLKEAHIGFEVHTAEVTKSILLGYSIM
jgi:hypothetical protein